MTLSALLVSAGPASEKKQLIAIFNFEVDKLNLSGQALGSLTTHLEAELMETGRYQLIPRRDMLKNGDYSECFADPCRIQVGRELAAHMSLAAKVANLGSTCNVSLTLYDLRKGASLGTANVLGSCNDEGLAMAMEKGVRKLSKSTETKMMAEAARIAEKEALHGEKKAPELPSKPSDESVEMRMKIVRSSIATCAMQYRFRGSMNAKITIAPSGNVVRVSTKGAMGPFADCAARTIRTAQFERSMEGGEFSIPFVMR